ncbi:MAG: C25 family cysteine peptidase [Thermoplasmatales archaeon]|nr:C25 family cysteine peptidase [Thermoplasmatales archaeon]
MLNRKGKMLICALTPFVVLLMLASAVDISANEDINHSTRSANVPYKQIFVEFQEPKINAEGEYIKISVDNCSFLFDEGKPLLPKKTLVINLQFKTNVSSVYIDVKTKEKMLNKKLMLSPSPIPLGNQNSDDLNQVLSKIYPEEWYQYNILAGIDPETNKETNFLIIHFYPVRYIENENKIVYATSANIKIRYNEEKISKDVGGKGLYDMVVISPSSFTTILEDFAEYKNSTNIITKAVTLDEIYNGKYFVVQGRDDEEKIKYFIYNATKEWGINYVLLAGDTDVLPVRYADVPDGEDDEDCYFDGRDVPTDLYYADVFKATGDFCSWDDNNNDLFGEIDVDGVDGMPDVYIGRLPASDTSEMQLLVDKIMNYELSDNTEWFNNALLVGTDTFTEEQHEDKSGIPEGEYTKEYVKVNYMSNFNVTKLYETDIYQKDGNITTDNILNNINIGKGFVDFSNHGSYTGVIYLNGGTGSCMLNSAHVDTLTNKNKLPVVIADACSTNGFDNIYHSGECLGEHFMLNPNGGSIVYIGSTRVGWGYYGELSVLGLSSYMDVQLHKAYHDGKHTPGGMLAAAQKNYMAYVGIYSSHDYKTVLEYNLLGDPSLHIGGGLDVQPPESHVNPISPYEQTSTITITAAANDPSPGSGVKNVSLYYRYRYLEDNPWSSWVFYGIDENIKDGISWTFYADNIGYYQFYSIATDKAGNIEETPSVEDAECYVAEIILEKIENPIIVNDVAFQGSPTSSSVKLTWLAPPWQAVSYEIRCRTDNKINDTNWETSKPIPCDIDGTLFEPNETISSIATNLNENTEYYFAIKGKNPAGFHSNVSNFYDVKSSSDWIKTLKYEAWPDDLEPEFAVGRNISFWKDKTVENTEVCLKGNLRVINSKTLTFNRVFFVVDCSEDFEYRIAVAPSVTGYVSGGRFEVYDSNITARVDIMPDGTEFWCPYLFFAYENSRFWLKDSSMHHCGGKPEDIDNVEISFAQIDAELNTELGIEIRSSDVSIEDSTISQNWGIFIRSSLPMSASPAIKHNIIHHNRYGIVIKPKIDITEQWPINLIVNNITNNYVGVYSDGARVGLKGCTFSYNSYGAIYNNTPTDYPGNVSGVIDGCIFENNDMAIKSKSSSLKIIKTYILNNTRLHWENRVVSNEIYASIYSENSFIEITGGRISNNTYLKWENSTVSNTIVSTIYCRNTMLNITNKVDLSHNSGVFFNHATIINNVDSDSWILDSMVSTIYHENSSLTVKNANFSNNGWPFYSDESYYILRVYVNDTLQDEEKIPIKASMSFQGINDEEGIIGALLRDGLPLHYSTVCARTSGINFAYNDFYKNLNGIVCLGSVLVVEHNNIVGPGWYGDLLSITGVPGYFIFSMGSPFTLRNNNVSESFIGVIFGLAEGNITHNVFEHNFMASMSVGSAEIPDIVINLPYLPYYMGIGPFSFSIRIPSIIKTVLGILEHVNVVANLSNNMFYNNTFSFIPIYSTIKIDNNTFLGLGGDDYFLRLTFVTLISGESTITMENCNFTSHLLLYGYGIHACIQYSSVSVKECFTDFSYIGFYSEESSLIIKDSNITSGFGVLGYGEEENVLIVENSFLFGCWYGCSVENTNLTIKNSVFSDSDHAVDVLEDSIAYIDNCRMINNTGEEEWYEGELVGVGAVRAEDSTLYMGDYTVITGSMYGLWAKNSVLNITDTYFSENTHCIYCKEGGFGGFISLTNSSLYKSNCGLTVNSWEIDVNTNTFTNLSTGISMMSTSGKINLNNRIKYSGTGIWSSGSTIEINNNDFYQNNIGIDSVSSSLTIINNTIGYGDYGVKFYMKALPEPDIVNNIIYNVTVGIECEGSSPNILNNKIFSCNKAILLKSDSSNSPCIEGNMIKNNDYGIYCKTLWWSYPVIKNSIIENNTIYGIYSGGWYYKCNSLIIENTTISRGGYGLFLMETYDVVIVNSSVSNNSYGIYCENSFVTIKNTVIASNTGETDSYGLYCYNSPTLIANSTLTNNTLDVGLYNSKAECINTIFSSVNFTDGYSGMDVYYYLTVSVTWYNVTSGGLNNEPVNNASITIYNVNDVPTNLSTDINGIVYTKVLTLRLNKTTMLDGVTFMPHRVNASKYGISNETKQFYVNETRYVELVLYDLESPSVSINPVFFNITNNPLLTLTGTASDNIEVWKVEISTDNVTWGGCNLTVTNSTAGKYTVSWSGTVTLSEGFNTVYVMVKDFAGNNKTDSRTITLDTTPPTLIITSVIPETTNQATLTITGTTDPDAILTINTVSVGLDENGNFSKTFSLNEGVNVFIVAASDPLGNENRTVLLTIVFDSTPPTSGIAYIKSPTNTLTGITGTANDDISGVKRIEICIIRESDGYYWTDTGWSLAEAWLSANGTSTWSYPWTPENDGVYTIMSRATDNADNTEIVPYSITFTYDTTPPTLTNIKPSNNTETESETITVSGETDGVNVTVNGVSVDVENGKFSATVKLGTGNNERNVITIIATDGAGNTNQTTIVVKRISGEWIPPSTEWIGLLAGITVIALIIVVWILYKRKIKLKAKL